MSGTHKKDARRIEAAGRSRDAADLRIRGFSYQEIADELGLSHRASAKKAIDRAIERLPQENATTWRKVLLGRLDEAHKAAAELLTDKDKEIRIRAAQAIARVAERIARITGLERDAAVIALLPPPVPLRTGDDDVDLSKLSMNEVRVLEFLTSAAKGQRRDFGAIRAHAQAWMLENAPAAIAELPATTDGPVVHEAQVVDDGLDEARRMVAKHGA